MDMVLNQSNASKDSFSILEFEHADNFRGDIHPNF